MKAGADGFSLTLNTFTIIKAHSRENMLNQLGELCRLQHDHSFKPRVYAGTKN